MPELSRYRRREAVGLGVGGVVAASFGAGFWRDLFAAEARPVRRGFGYGRLGAPDGHGIRLPPGFRSRLVARGGEPVPGTEYPWHLDSDGAAVFRAAAGFVLVSNSEADEGGASAISFDAGGRVQDAYRILEGTRKNCSGGATPWGTWLSCEEVGDGLVWECDPSGHHPAVGRPAMGAFKHEAAAVDPRNRCVYLTEDLEHGGLYRFTPQLWPDLSAGLLEIAVVRPGGRVVWKQVPDPGGRRLPTRRQVRDATHFARAEGIWLDRGVVYVATTADSRIHAYDTRRQQLDLLYDADRHPEPPLTRVDALVASAAGDLFVCEDKRASDLDIGIITRSREVFRFLSVTGRRHRASELTGVAFDPTGTRLFFASQRAGGAGEVYEVTGPFGRGRG
jgi:secreted PhoX family phosphatase